MEGAVSLPESEDKGLRVIEDGMSMVLDTKKLYFGELAETTFSYSVYYATLL